MRSHAAVSLNAVNRDLGPGGGRAVWDRSQRPAARYQCVPGRQHFSMPLPEVKRLVMARGALRSLELAYVAPSSEVRGEMPATVSPKMHSTIPLRRDLTHLDGPEMNHFPGLRVHFRDYAVRIQASRVALGLQLAHPAMKQVRIPLTYNNGLCRTHARPRSATRLGKIQLKLPNLAGGGKRVCDADHIC